MATTYRELFRDAERQQVLADALAARAMQPRGPTQQGRITPTMHWGEGLAQLGEALIARRAGKQASAKTEAAEEARRKAQAAALSGMANPPNLVERPEVQSPYGRAQTALEADVHPAVVQQYMQQQLPEQGNAGSASIQGYNLAKSQGYEGTYLDYKREFEGREANLPSSVQEWQTYNSLSPEDQSKYLEMKRSVPIETVNQVPTRVLAGGVQQPLSTVESEAQAAGNIRFAETRAGEMAEQERETAKAQQEKLATYRLYEEARRGLLAGLEGTETGPIAGRIPAVTAAQQTAEGGIAAMAPVLKQLFRAAGEGIFTDKDQALLLDMVPKRTDEPEARVAKMANIDAIVKAKLGISEQGDGLQVGAVEDGYEYVGGDPSKPESWRKL